MVASPDAMATVGSRPVAAEFHVPHALIRDSVVHPDESARCGLTSSSCSAGCCGEKGQHTRQGTGEGTKKKRCEELEGTYLRTTDHKVMGSIAGTTLRWASDFGVEPTEITFRAGILFISLGGQIHIAKFDWPELLWDDGEVWRRSDQPAVAKLPQAAEKESR
eukprot:TRINITY_DN63962_c0_g1_i1.p1 TRINITY_DN63962_c0_g1~~TRINITY_DN63962_c0_g1_i1.p1  ORF type:complete len:181 (+),score=18.38 TRINITY_DN63962_c0_g1_i1:56-544(+)